MLHSERKITKHFIWEFVATAIFALTGSWREQKNNTQTSLQLHRFRYRRVTCSCTFARWLRAQCSWALNAPRVYIYLFAYSPTSFALCHRDDVSRVCRVHLTCASGYFKPTVSLLQITETELNENRTRARRAGEMGFHVCAPRTKRHTHYIPFRTANSPTED